LDPDEQERLLEEKRRQEERDAEEKKAASAKLKEEQSYMFPPRGLFAPFVGAGSAASALLTSATSDRATEVIISKDVSCDFILLLGTQEA